MRTFYFWARVAKKILLHPVACFHAAIAVFNMVEKFDYGILIETENKSVEETADEIISHLPE